MRARLIASFPVLIPQFGGDGGRKGRGFVIQHIEDPADNFFFAGGELIVHVFREDGDYSGEEQLITDATILTLTFGLEPEAPPEEP